MRRAVCSVNSMFVCFSFLIWPYIRISPTTISLNVSLMQRFSFQSNFSIGQRGTIAFTLLFCMQKPKWDDNLRLIFIENVFGSILRFCLVFSSCWCGDSTVHFICAIFLIKTTRPCVRRLWKIEPRLD